MAQFNALRHQLLETLTHQLIPWVGEKSPFVLLDAPPRVLGPTVITEQPGKELAFNHGSRLELRVEYWKEENLNAMAAPYMGVVVDGEADIITATTRDVCRKLKIPGKRWIINAPQKTLILAPPRVPLSRGERPHWEREHPELAYSRILWMQFHTNGINCHFCTTEKGKHWSHPYYFIYGPEFFPLSKVLIHEMKEAAPHYEPLIYSTLNTLFHYMLRGLTVKPGREEEEDVPTGVSPLAIKGDELVQPAIDFIDQNLNERLLTVEQIALHLHVSPRHLSRIFRRDMQMTVMEFVTKRRMELACQLLTESQFNVTKISGYCGYTAAPSFIKAFIRHFGCSPTTYRAANHNKVRSD